MKRRGFLKALLALPGMALLKAPASKALAYLTDTNRWYLPEAAEAAEPIARTLWVGARPNRAGLHFKTVSDALKFAQSGDRILVVDETYKFTTPSERAS